MFTRHINSRGLTFLEILIICSIIVILAVMAIPNSRTRGRPFPRIKQCFANQRVLAGAVEMYNMDVKKENMMHSLDQEILLKEKYIKTPIQGPEKNCKYFSVGDLAQDGIICCEYHGDVLQKHMKSKTE